MKKLLVLDINGVLADVINGDVPEQIKANHGKFGKRHFLLPLNTDPNVTELHKGKTYGVFLFMSLNLNEFNWVSNYIMV
jgi:hypothetical protein